MKRFEFRLERVREWRFVRMELEQARLEELFGELHSLEAAERRLAAEIEEAERGVQAAATGQRAVEGHQFVELDEYRLYVRRQEQRLAAQKAEVRERIAAQRERLLLARRDYRLLEKLKEKAFKQWQAGYDKEIENLASEMFLAQWKG